MPRLPTAIRLLLATGLLASAFGLVPATGEPLVPSPGAPKPATAPAPAPAAAPGPARGGAALPPAALAGAAAPRASEGNPDGIALASPRAAASREPSAGNAWGGARTGNEANLSDRVVNYEIQATLDPDAHTVDGRETLTWHNRSNRTVRAVYLHLYLNAFEGEGSTFHSERRRLGFGFRSDVPVRDGQWGYIQLGAVRQAEAPVAWAYVHPDGGPESDHTVVRLDLPAPVAPGGSTSLQIEFHDQLPRVIARTGYFGSFHLVGQWYPKMAVLELAGERGLHEPQWNAHEFHLHSEFYADFGAFDVRLTVPRGYVVGATGEEIGEPAATAETLTHHFVQGDVHDFAWTADLRSAPPLEAEAEVPGGGRVHLRVLFPPEYAHCAPHVLQATREALDYFSRTLGPYPYRTVTAVIPPFNAGEAGGMEYPTFFTADRCSGPRPGSLDASLLDLVTVHEFGHGYFYGILASNEFEEPILDEGLNEFWDTRYFVERGQPFGMGSWLTRLLGVAPAVGWVDLHRMQDARRHPSDPLGGNSWDRMSTEGYASVYARTTLALHDLEAAVGHEAMGRAMHLYYERWKFRHPGVADLRAALAEGTGDAALVDRLFTQQVYGVEALDDRVEKFTSEESLPELGGSLVDGGRVERKGHDRDQQVEQARAQWAQAHPHAAEGTGPYPFHTLLVLRHRGAAVRQAVEVRFADGSSERFTWDSPERWSRYTWDRPARAVSVRIDPDGANSLNASDLASGRQLQGDGAASRRWSLDLAALTQLLAALLAGF